jgi:cysteine synthase
MDLPAGEVGVDVGGEEGLIAEAEEGALDVTVGVVPAEREEVEGVNVDAITKLVDNSLGREVIVALAAESVSLIICRRARWMCGCGGGAALAPPRKMAEKLRSIVVVFIAVVWLLKRLGLYVGKARGYYSNEGGTCQRWW